MVSGGMAAVAGVLLALSLAAPPGPMNALIAREAGRHGAWAAIRVGIAAPIVDALYLGLLWFGLSQLIAGVWVVRGAAAVGAVLMFYFAVQSARPQADASEPPARFWAAMLMAASNPYQIGWWLSGGFVFVHEQGARGVVGFLAGIFLWVLGFAWLMAHGARRWAWFRPLVDILAAGLLLLFALLLAGVAVGFV
jgi:threonine/homoserine/homoserine lactone efflux protein